MSFLDLNNKKKRTSLDWLVDFWYLHLSQQLRSYGDRPEKLGIKPMIQGLYRVIGLTTVSWRLEEAWTSPESQEGMI